MKVKPVGMPIHIGPKFTPLASSEANHLHLLDWKEIRRGRLYSKPGN